MAPSTQSRKRKNPEGDEEASSEEEATITTTTKTKKPAKKRAKKVEISVQERETLVSNIIRFLLFKHASKQPIRRKELADATIKKTHGSRPGLLDELFAEAQRRMRHLFEMEAVPISRAIPPGNGPILFRVPFDDELEKNPKKKSKPDMWIVRLTQHPDEDGETIAESALYARSHELNQDSDDAPRMGLLTVIYSLLACSTYRLDESELWNHLKKFGIEKDEDHPVFGKVALVLEDLTKELYLSRIKDEEASRDATDRNGVRTLIFYYTFGPRLHAEAHPRHVVEFLEHVTGTPIPDLIHRHIGAYDLVNSGDQVEEEMNTQPITQHPIQQVYDFDDE